MPLENIHHEKGPEENRQIDQSQQRAESLRSFIHHCAVVAGIICVGGGNTGAHAKTAQYELSLGMEKGARTAKVPPPIPETTEAFRRIRELTIKIDRFLWPQREEAYQEMLSIAKNALCLQNPSPLPIWIRKFQKEPQHSPDQKCHLERLFEETERLAVLLPSIIQPHEDISALKAARLLTKTENDVEIADETYSKLRQAPRLSIERGRNTFWEVMDQVCTASGTQHFFRNPSTMKVIKVTHCFSKLNVSQKQV